MPSDFEQETLHAVMGAFDTALEKEAAKAIVERVEKLLEGGADPNEEDAHEQTPLAILVDRPMHPSSEAMKAAHQVIAVMIRAGANPLIKDCPIGKAEVPGLGFSMLKGIAAAAREGKEIEDEMGGNVLHVLASENPPFFHWALSHQRMALDDKAMLGDQELDVFPLPENWLHLHRPKDGATPLHALVGEYSLLQVLNEFAKESGEYDDVEECADNVWWGISEAMKMGADLNAVNHKKKSVASVIAKMVKKRALPLVSEDAEETFREVQSVDTQEKLQKSTPKAGKKRPGARL